MSSPNNAFFGMQISFLCIVHDYVKSQIQRPGSVLVVVGFLIVQLAQKNVVFQILVSFVFDFEEVGGAHKALYDSRIDDFFEDQSENAKRKALIMCVSRYS